MMQIQKEKDKKKWIEEDKSLVPSGFWTHNLMIKVQVHDRCATTAASILNSYAILKKYSLIIILQVVKMVKSSIFFKNALAYSSPQSKNHRTRPIPTSVDQYWSKVCGVIFGIFK